jgi:hypothetical protein
VVVLRRFPAAGAAVAGMDEEAAVRNSREWNWLSRFQAVLSSPSQSVRAAQAALRAQAERQRLQVRQAEAVQRAVSRLSPSSRPAWW